MPVLHAQGIRDITQAERILANGWVDMCGMTRAQIADPHMMLKVREGREDQIKQCVGANYCIDRMYLGSGCPLRAEPRDLARGDDAACHHADEGREAPRRRRGRGPRRTRGGAGVAGRGHDVVLFERDEKVGGQINLAAKAPQREQMAGHHPLVRSRDEALGRRLRLGVEATDEMVLAERPDIVVLATGGRSHTDQVPEWGVKEGLAVSAWDILVGEGRAGRVLSSSMTASARMPASARRTFSRAAAPRSRW